MFFFENSFLFYLASLLQPHFSSPFALINHHQNISKGTRKNKTTDCKKRMKGRKKSEKDGGHTDCEEEKVGMNYVVETSKTRMEA